MLTTYRALIRQTADLPDTSGTATPTTATATVEVLSAPGWKILAVKVGIVFIHAFLGALAWDSRAFTNIGDIWAHIGFAASVALATAGVAMVQKLGEFLTKWDQTHPQWTS